MEVRRAVGRPGAGRADELAAIATARDDAYDGHGSFVVVSGEAGLGKTWLLQQGAAAAEEAGFTVGWSSCRSMRDAPPLWPWWQAASEICGAPVDVPSRSDPGGEGVFEHHLALGDRLREATVERPGLLILDDAHEADEATLQLARLMAHHVRNLRLLVLVAHRPTESLAELDRDANLLVLGGLDRPEVASVLADHGVESLPDPDLDFIVEATGGHPADVKRVATGSTEPVWAVVASLVADLSDEVRDLALRAAVLGAAPSLREVAAVGGVSDRDASRALLDMARQHLVLREGPDRVVFASESVRAALAAELSPAELVDVHARAVDALSSATPGSSERSVRRARHALAAAGRSVDDARRAIDLAEDAAAQLAVENDHTAAASLLAAACDVYEQAGFGSPPAALLAAHGTAVLRTGRLAAARQLFEQAARAARAEDDPVSAAVAAAGYGGVWLSEMRSPLDRERVLGLQRRALAALPDDQVALRHRLTARLTAEDAYVAGRPDLMEPVLAAARELDDPVVLAETLSLHHHTMLGPDQAEGRLPVARELLSVATDAGDALLSLMGLCWLTVDLFLSGQPDAVRSLGALRERTDALDCRSIGYIAEVLEVMLLIRAGRLDEAEAAAARAYETGVEVGDADALAYHGAQLVIIKWLQGRSAEMLGLVGETATSPTLIATNHAFVAVYAALAADCGELDQARAALNRLRAAVFAERGPDRPLPVFSSSATLATLASVIEAAHILGDTATAELAGRLLEPFADLPVMASLGVICMGSAQRPLGLAALTAGDTDLAVSRLEAAVVANERLGNRPMGALTRADLARALHERDGRGDRTAALEHLDHAIREGTALGLTGRVDDWRRRRAWAESDARARTVDVEDRADGEERADREELADLEGRVGVIRRQGAGWILDAGTGDPVVIGNLVGMSYLTQLLTQPGREIGATDLVAGPAESEVWRAEQPMLDDRALAEYRQRVVELEDEIAEADRFADTERAARARVQLESIVDELSHSTNLQGASRSFPSSPERARTAVRKALRRALDQIEAADPALGAALRQSVRTGRTCCYEPGPGAPKRWEGSTTSL